MHIYAHKKVENKHTVVVHTFNPWRVKEPLHLGDRGWRISELEANLIYRGSSKAARGTQKNPVLKNKQTPKPKTITKKPQTNKKPKKLKPNDQPKTKTKQKKKKTPKQQQKGYSDPDRGNCTQQLGKTKQKDCVIKRQSKATEGGTGEESRGRMSSKCVLEKLFTDDGAKN